MQDNPRSNDQRTTAVLSQQHDLALIEVDAVLGRFGYGLADFDLPLPASTGATKQASKELKRELEFNRDYETERAETQRAMMRQNPEQAEAYDTIVDHVLPGGLLAGARASGTCVFRRHACLRTVSVAPRVPVASRASRAGGCARVAASPHLQAMQSRLPRFALTIRASFSWMVQAAQGRPSSTRQCCILHGERDGRRWPVRGAVSPPPC